MPLLSCSACGNQIPDAAPRCPHCGQPVARTGGRRGLPVWGKLLLFLFLGVAVVVLFAANKPSEADLRQAIGDRGKELQGKGVMSHLTLIDDPQHAGRFTYHDHFFTSEIKFPRDDGKVITVARGQIGDIAVSEKEGG